MREALISFSLIFLVNQSNKMYFDIGRNRKVSPKGMNSLKRRIIISFELKVDKVIENRQL